MRKHKSGRSLHFRAAHGTGVSLRGHAHNPLKDRNEIVVIVKSAFGRDLYERKPGLLCQQLPGFFHAEIPDMLCDPHAVILLCDLVELRSADAELPGQRCSVQFLCKMHLDIFIDLHRELLAAQRHHPFHTQKRSDGLHDMGSGGDVIRRDGRLLSAGGVQRVKVNPVAPAQLLNLPPPLFIGGIRKNLSEQQVSDGNVSDDDRGDAFGEPGMAAVGIEGPALCGGLACPFVTAVAAGGGLRVRADDLAEGRGQFRIRGKFMEGIVKYGDADPGHVMEIFQ